MTESQTILGHVLVLGMGMTGEYVARYCAALLGGRVLSVTLYGGASSAKGDASEALTAQGVHCVLGCEAVEGNYDLCIASPGISEFSPFFVAAKNCSKEIISEPEFAWCESPRNWIAITGTNGKTTTTSLTTAILHEGQLRATSVGNIGFLATKALAGRADDEWFVAELSSFQLACSKTLHPRVAMLLNVTPDHIAWHKSIENYAAAKERIFANLKADDLAIISDTDAWCCAIAERLQARNLRVCLLNPARDAGSSCAAFVRAGQLVVRLDGTEYLLVRADELQIKGEHNLADALAAAAAALELGIDAEAVNRCLKSFHPLEHRIEPCGELKGVHFVNDSKATNVDATEKALAAFKPGSLVLLLGGHDKGTNLDELSKLVVKTCAGVVCFGEAGPRFAKTIRAHVSKDSTLHLRTVAHLADAVDTAWELAHDGQTILLSPACSSFDEFSGFEERGRVFKDLVVRLIAAGGLQHE